MHYIELVIENLLFKVLLDFYGNSYDLKTNNLLLKGVND